MSSPDFRLFQSGNLTGVFYTFKEEHDTLPRHQHLDDLTNHLVIVLQGSVVVREFNGDEIEKETLLEAGQVFDGGSCPVDHEIEGLVAGTKIFNIVKGQPEGNPR